MIITGVIIISILVLIWRVHFWQNEHSKIGVTFLQSFCNHEFEQTHDCELFEKRFGFKLFRCRKCDVTVVVNNTMRSIIPIQEFWEIQGINGKDWTNE